MSSLCNAVCWSAKSLWFGMVDKVFAANATGYVPESFPAALRVASYRLGRVLDQDLVLVPSVWICIRCCLTQLLLKGLT